MVHRYVPFPVYIIVHSHLKHNLRGDLMSSYSQCQLPFETKLCFIFEAQLIRTALHQLRQREAAAALQ